MKLQKNIKVDNFIPYNLEKKIRKVFNINNMDSKEIKWRKDFNEIFSKYFETGINLPMDMKLKFTALLMIYPFTEKDDIIFNRLNDNQRVGYVNKHMLKRAKRCKVPDELLNKLKSLRKDFKHYKNNSVKNQLNSYTDLILEMCFNRNTRMGKLDLILNDD